MAVRPPLWREGDRPRPARWAVALLVASAAFLLLALALLLFRAGPSWRGDPARALGAAGAPSHQSRRGGLTPLGFGGPMIAVSSLRINFPHPVTPGQEAS